MEAALPLHLQRMIEAAAFSSRVRRATRKIGERHVLLHIRAGRQYDGRQIRAGAGKQMSSERADVPDRERIVRRDLVLNAEIHALHVRSLEIVLNAAQV